jgi:hypothetical protein
MKDIHAEAAHTTPTASDSAMAMGDPAMFASLTTDENQILNHHLTSGWYKQGAVYPTLSEPWRETSALLDDLSAAWWAAWNAEREPEAGQ